MASLPEDDGPTMVGAAGEQRKAPRSPTGHDGLPADAAVGLLEDDSDDTTSAAAGPPASPRDLIQADDDDDEEDEEGDRTVQQAVPPNVAAAAAAAARARPMVPSTSMASTASRRLAASLPVPVPASSKPPVPSAAPPAVPPAASALPPVRDVAKTDATELTDDDDPIEDSITATAPRINAANLMEAAQSGRGVPLSIPGRVEIRTLEDDDDLGDETEVRTRPGHAALDVPSTLRAPNSAIPAPRPAAGRPPDVRPAASNALPVLSDDDLGDEDGVTTQAAAPRMGSSPNLGAPSRALASSAGDSSEDPPTRPGVSGAEESPTRPGLGGEEEPSTRPGVEGALEAPTRPGLPDPITATKTSKVDSVGYANDADDDDDSVTTRGPAAEPYGEDSVTTQAPSLPIELINAAIEAAGRQPDPLLDDGTEGTTKKLKGPQVAAPPPSPADDEAESITTQAPGHVTNMLRVIASGSSPDLDTGKLAMPLEEDEGPENRTAVMANAPLQRIVKEADSISRLPAIRPTGGPLSHGAQAVAAPRLEPSSESGMRVARSGSGSGERASLGVLAVGDGRISGEMRTGALASDGSISGAHGREIRDLNYPTARGSNHEEVAPKSPSYVLLVAIVAAISIAVPAVLFVVLRHDSEAVARGMPAEPVSEVEKFPVVVRAKRGKNGLPVPASASASASAAPSSVPSGKPGARGFPFKR